MLQRKAVFAKGYMACFCCQGGKKKPQQTYSYGLIDVEELDEHVGRTLSVPQACELRLGHPERLARVAGKLSLSAALQLWPGTHKRYTNLNIELGIFQEL